MKKLIIMLSLLVWGAACAFATMEAQKYTITSAKTATNSATYVLRGYIDCIYVDITSTCTSTVYVISDQQVIHTNSAITADAAYFPRRSAFNTANAGAIPAALYHTNSYVDRWYSGTNDANLILAQTNTIVIPQIHLERMAVAGDVTVTLIGGEATRTNSAVITIIYEKP